LQENWHFTKAHQSNFLEGHYTHERMNETHDVNFTFENNISL